MNTIYIRTLKHAEHTVFVVENGQKTYFDPQFSRYVPYSSGQQVKRSIIDTLNEKLNTIGSPTTFLFDVTKKKELKEGEVYATCDPQYADQILGGWMKAAKGGKERTLKRRSPLSISAMRGLHPLLAGISKESQSFDRSEKPNTKIIVRDDKGNVLSKEDVEVLLEGKDRSLSRKWIPSTPRASGLFVLDLAIDLRRLFSITINPLEPEVSTETEKMLREQGWIETKNVFGDCLTAPKELREKWIPALVDAIIDWKITSNQSRTFSLMETLALAITNNANKAANAIRAKLVDNGESMSAKPIVDESIEGADVFVTLPAAGYFITNGETADALDKAKENLTKMLLEFDYENQL